MDQLTTIANLASLTFGGLGLYYGRRSAPGHELWAAAAMFLVAAVGQIVALGADILGGAGWLHLVVDAALMTGLLVIAWITWARADRADEAAGDTKGDLW